MTTSHERFTHNEHLIVRETSAGWLWRLYNRPRSTSSSSRATPIDRAILLDDGQFRYHSELINIYCQITPNTKWLIGHQGRMYGWLRVRGYTKAFNMGAAGLNVVLDYVELAAHSDPALRAVTRREAACGVAAALIRDTPLPSTLRENEG